MISSLLHSSMIKLLNCIFYFYFYRLNQPPLSGSGSGSGLTPRKGEAPLSPLDSDSDSDISLGTHSPVPSMSMQHSPGSMSGGNDRDDRLTDERDREKDYRPFPSLHSFRFGDHLSGGLMPSKSNK